MSHRILLTTALVLCLAVNPALAQQNTTSDTDPAKLQAAKRYLDNMQLQHSFENIYEALAERLPGEHAEKVIVLMREEVRMDNVRDIIQHKLVQHYTLEELEALAEFYSSETGRAITRKLPAYLEDVNAAIQSEAQRAFKAALEEFQRQAQAEAAAQQQEQPAAEGSGQDDAKNQEDAAAASGKDGAAEKNQ